MGNEIKQDLASFELRRLRTALLARSVAGTTWTERLCDRAIVSLLSACDREGAGTQARAMIPVYLGVSE